MRYVIRRSWGNGLDDSLERSRRFWELVRCCDWQRGSYRQTSCQRRVFDTAGSAIVAKDKDGHTLQHGHRYEDDAFDDQDDVVVTVTLLVAGLAQYRSHHATDGEDASTAETVSHETEKEEEKLPRGLAKH